MSPAGVLPAGDQATVSTSVAVEPAVAFEVFTQEIDLWWRRGLRNRIAGRRPGSLSFELALGAASSSRLKRHRARRSTKSAA
jgi:hypothetical protein